jgi:drug/metabolite transporter (DMT)-like permease
MAFALALGAALVYGAADFLGGLASRRTSTLGIVIWSQIVGLLLLAVALPALGGRPGADDIAWGAACGVCGAAAIVLLYRGLAIGKMGVVSPLSAVVGASVAMSYGILFQAERPAWLAYAGIAAAFAAIVCVSTDPGDPVAPAHRGILEAILAGIGFGAYFIALSHTHASAGMYPLLAARVASVLLLLGGALAFGKRAGVRVTRPALPIVVAAGTLDMGANVLFVLAAHSGMLAIVAVLTSLYPVATVALAGVVLRERLDRRQWAGGALALAGAAAIAAG